MTSGKFMLHYMQFHSTSLPPHLLTFPLPSTLSPKAYGINTSDKLPSQLSFTVASERMQIVIQCLTPPLFLSLSHPAFISLQLVMDVFIVWLSESFTSSYCFSQRHGEKPLIHPTYTWTNMHAAYDYQVARFASQPTTTQTKLSWKDCHDSAKKKETDETSVRMSSPLLNLCIDRTQSF